MRKKIAWFVEELGKEMKWFVCIDKNLSYLTTSFKKMRVSYYEIYRQRSAHSLLGPGNVPSILRMPELQTAQQICKKHSLIVELLKQV